MKTKLLGLIVALPLVTAVHGAAILLGGFDGNQTESTVGSIRYLDDPVQDAGAVGNFDMSLSTDLTGKTGFTGFDWSAGFQSSTATWGVSTFTTGASTANNNAVYATDTGTYTHTINMVLTNTGLNDITLDKFHIRVKRDGTNSPTGIRFTYASGDLTDTPGGNTLLDVGPPSALIAGYDLAFSSVVTDLTLAAGESATFTWVTEGGSGQRFRVDNIGVSGVVALPPDNTAPIPNPMTWFSVPAAAGESSITMTATTATDDISTVEYEFTRYASDGVTVLFTSPWQDSPAFTDTGLDPATEYKYTVRARDLSLNVTDPSTPLASATTDPADGTAPTPDPMTFLVAPLPVSSSAITMTATTATDDSGVEYQFTRYAADGTTLLFTSPWQNSPTYIDTGLDPDTEYTYTVMARDKSIAQNMTAASTPVASATTHPAAGIGTTLVGGYHGANETALQSPTITGVDVTLTNTTGDITQGNSQISSTLWGTTALDVASPGDTNAIFQGSTLTPFTLTLTVTNNQAVDLPLDALHFIVKKDINNVGPQDFTIAYSAGDLGSPASTIVGLPNGINGFDVPLASFLGDTTLAAGESATFTWTPGSPQDPSGNTAIRIDNFAISSPVSGPGGTTYAIWSGGAAANADTNGDGVENAVAYALGAADVDENAINRLPTLDSSDPSNVVFTFDRSDDAEADSTTAITVEYGSDLSGWTTAVDGEGGVSIDDSGVPSAGLHTVVVTIPKSGGKLFARLRVTVTP